MRSLFLVLLLLNLVVFAMQFDTVKHLVVGASAPARPQQVNAERLRIIRDTSGRTRTPLPAASGTAP